MGCSEWRIVGYGTGALWDLWDSSIDSDSYIGGMYFAENHKKIAIRKVFVFFLGKEVQNHDNMQ